MGSTFIFFLLVIFFVAVLTRDSYSFILLYFFTGAFLLSRWWVNHVSQRITYRRIFEQRVFPGEKIPVRVVIKNESRLPLIWLQAQESLPLEVSPRKTLQEVFSIKGRGLSELRYMLHPYKRGVYPIGPIQLATGDLLGLTNEKIFAGQSDNLTVYPKVIPLTKVQIPSHSPYGTLRHKQPIFEDPTRPMGKRDYVAGDSLRRIDWKSTASVGRLQTKLYEPSITLETLLLVNLNSEEYHYKFRFQATELAIVVAASIATWMITKQQSAGLIVNGLDPFSDDALSPALTPKKGRIHLMRLLETLARVQMAERPPLAQLLRQKRFEINWGTTVMVFTGQADEPLFEEFFQLQRTGMNVVLILCGEVPGLQEIKARANHFQIPVFHFQDERDLDIWRV